MHDGQCFGDTGAAPVITMTSPVQNCYFEKLTDQTERHHEMVMHTQKVQTQIAELLEGERNLIGVSHKNAFNK